MPYQEEKEKKEYSDSTLTNFIWLLARLSSSSSGVQNIPSWSDIHQVIYIKTYIKTYIKYYLTYLHQDILQNIHQVPKATIGYLQPIAAPPTDINVIFAVINRSLDIPHLFLEADQAIYTKVLDVMFRVEFDEKQIFDKIVPRMGGFHVLLFVAHHI